MELLRRRSRDPGQVGEEGVGSEAMVEVQRVSLLETLAPIKREHWGRVNKGRATVGRS